MQKYVWVRLYAEPFPRTNSTVAHINVCFMILVTVMLVKWVVLWKHGTQNILDTLWKKWTFCLRHTCPEYWSFIGEKWRTQWKLLKMAGERTLLENWYNESLLVEWRGMEYNMLCVRIDTQNQKLHTCMRMHCIETHKIHTLLPCRTQYVTAQGIWNRLVSRSDFSTSYRTVPVYKFTRCLWI